MNELSEALKVSNDNVTGIVDRLVKRIAGSSSRNNDSLPHRCEKFQCKLRDRIAQVDLAFLFSRVGLAGFDTSVCSILLPLSVKISFR